MENWRAHHIGDKRLVGDVERNKGEVSLRMENGSSLSVQEYLDTYIPSRDCRDFAVPEKESAQRPSEKANDGVTFFWVFNDNIPSAEINFPAMNSEWEKLTARFVRNPRRIQPSHIFQIARKYSYKSGKWISYHKAGEAVNPDYIQTDTAWKLVVKLITEGELKTTAMAAYIRVCEPPITGTAEQEYQFCIRNEDYTNEHQMNSIEKVLRNAGIGADHRLRYKLDIYTEFDIYPRNCYGLRPTIR